MASDVACPDPRSRLHSLVGSRGPFLGADLPPADRRAQVFVQDAAYGTGAQRRLVPDETEHGAMLIQVRPPASSKTATPNRMLPVIPGDRNELVESPGTRSGATRREVGPFGYAGIGELVGNVRPHAEPEIAIRHQGVGHEFGRSANVALDDAVRVVELIEGRPVVAELRVGGTECHVAGTAGLAYNLLEHCSSLCCTFHAGGAKVVSNAVPGCSAFQPATRSLIACCGLLATAKSFSCWNRDSKSGSVGESSRPPVSGLAVDGLHLR